MSIYTEEDRFHVLTPAGPQAQPLEGNIIGAGGLLYNMTGSPVACATVSC
jgi:hypothetical protein